MLRGWVYSDTGRIGVVAYAGPTAARRFLVPGAVRSEAVSRAQRSGGPASTLAAGVVAALARRLPGGPGGLAAMTSLAGTDLLEHASAGDGAARGGRGRDRPGGGSRLDLARQAANVAGALFQVGMTAAASRGITEVTSEGPRSLVEPAPYAFAIWGPIFALSGAYAAYQALPANRESPLLRGVGWFTAGAFGCTGMWSVFVPRRQLLPAQAMLLGALGCLAVAYVRVARDGGRRVPSRGDRWLVALPVGLFFGWVAAADAVGLTSEAVRLGLVEGGGAGEEALGSALLLVGGVLASGLVRAGGAAPAQGYGAYGAAVLWALAGIVANQHAASRPVTAAAVVSAALVAAALATARGGTRRRERGERGAAVAR